jgi:hypothetical protein
MRAFDGIDEALAEIVEAKNHAVEVIGMHRFLAAPVRRSKENQNVNTSLSRGERAGVRDLVRRRSLDLAENQPIAI